MKLRYIAIKSYKSAYSEPLIASIGTKLHFERRKTEWEGWLWCTSLNGKSAWVPEAWVTIRGDYCTLIRDYSSTELDININDVIEGELIESGWIWVKNDKKAGGWVPLDCLNPLPIA